MVGAALSKRCGALEAVHAALELGEKAGYVLGGDNDGNEKTSEARYVNNSKNWNVVNYALY